ncbi:armadillo-type protein [Hysterangium stoloniferum]|nr:armadillo-type protein [Hysterangium stoloniferum]
MRLDSWFLSPCCAIAPAILDIVALLQDFYINVRFSAFSVLGKLSEKAEFRAAIAGPGEAFRASRILPTIVALLRDSDSDVRSSAVWVLGKVSEAAIVVLFKESDSDVRSSAVSVLGKMSEQAEFRAAIAPDIPTIVALLKDSDNNVRSSASSARVKFSEQEEFLPLVRAAICAAVGLSDKTQPTLPESLSIPLQRIPTPSSFPSRSDRFRDNPANVPHIRDLSGLPTRRLSSAVDLLHSTDCISRHEAIPIIHCVTITAWNFSLPLSRFDLREQTGKFALIPMVDALHIFDAFGTAITRAIFKNVALLKDSDSDVRSSAVSVLGKFSEQAEFRAAIAGVIPAIVALLKDSPWCVRSSSVWVLGKVSEQAEFRAAIASAIPDIVALLKDSDSDVRSSSVLVLGKVSEKAEFRPAIAAVIPAIVALLKDSGGLPFENG